MSTKDHTAPTYQIQNRSPLRYLDVSATYNAKEQAVYVNVLNRSKDRDIFTCFDYRQVIEIDGGQGRNRTADAGLFRAAYRIAEVV